MAAWRDFEGKNEYSKMLENFILLRLTYRVQIIKPIAVTKVKNKKLRTIGIWKVLYIIVISVIKEKKFLNVCTFMLSRYVDGNLLQIKLGVEINGESNRKIYIL